MGAQAPVATAAITAITATPANVLETGLAATATRMNRSPRVGS
jgi:hypothetical protein